MTSQINVSAIQQTYPVAGIDNDSQGFRDNFTAIATALNTAKTEINTLQAKALLNSDLASNATVVNSLNGSTISGGLYKQFNGVVFTANVAASSNTDINITNGPLQVFTATGAAPTLRFNSWPAAGQYSVVRVHLKTAGTVAVQVGPFTPLITAANGGTIVYAGGSTPNFALSNIGKNKVIEAWSIDSGATIYVNYLGEY